MAKDPKDDIQKKIIEEAAKKTAEETSKNLGDTLSKVLAKENKKVTDSIQLATEALSSVAKELGGLKKEMGESNKKRSKSSSGSSTKSTKTQAEKDAEKAQKEAEKEAKKAQKEAEKAQKEAEKAKKEAEAEKERQKAAAEKRENDRINLFGRLNGTIKGLEGLDKLNLSQRGKRKGLTNKAKALQDELKSEDVDVDSVLKQFRQLKFEQYQLEADINKTRHNLFGLMANAIGGTVGSIANSPKLSGAMSVGLGAMTGINPVFLQMLGIDKLAGKLGKWAGGTALRGLASLGKQAFTPIEWGEKTENVTKEKATETVEGSTAANDNTTNTAEKPSNTEEEKQEIAKQVVNGLTEATESNAIREKRTTEKKLIDNDDDGLANGTEKLRNEDSEVFLTIKDQVAGISETVKENRKTPETEDKKEKEGGVLATILKVVGTVIGVAANAAVAVIALAGKGIVEKLLSKVLEGAGFSEDTAKTLAGTVADIIPGAIIGYKFGGLKGALIGGGISLAYFTIRDYVNNFKKMSNGEVPDDIGGPWKGMFKGALMGAMIGMAFGPVGLLAGAVLGALGGGIVGFIEKNKSEKIKAELKEKEQIKDLDNAAEKGIKYDSGKAIGETNQRISDLKAYAEKNKGNSLGKDAQKMIKAYEEGLEEGDDYEKDRLDVQQKALKKFGTSDLSKLSLDQLEDIMDDDDAEFEAYLNELQAKGYLVNDKETRRALRHIWTENENLTWGENKNSKKAVRDAVHAMVSRQTQESESYSSQDMPTENEIISDSIQEQNENNTERLITKANNQSGQVTYNTTNNNMSMMVTNTKDTSVNSGQ